MKIGCYLDIDGDLWIYDGEKWVFYHSLLGQWRRHGNIMTREIADLFKLEFIGDL